jgi:predicted RNase H-like HicB family nuclease
MSKLPRVEVDFTSLNSTPVGRLKLGPVDGPDGDPDLAALWLVREQRVLFYDAERQVEGTVDYVEHRGRPYWLGDPDWSTLVDSTVIEWSSEDQAHPVTLSEWAESLTQPARIRNFTRKPPRTGAKSSRCSSRAPRQQARLSTRYVLTRPRHPDKQRGETTMPDEQPHYSMLIQWSADDHVYIVSFPEWAAASHITHIHGTTYTEAAAAGADLLAFMIRTAMRDGEALPAATLYADTRT